MPKKRRHFGVILPLADRDVLVYAAKMAGVPLSRLVRDGVRHRCFDVILGDLLGKPRKPLTRRQRCIYAFAGYLARWVVWCLDRAGLGVWDK